MHKSAVLVFLLAIGYCTAQPFAQPPQTPAQMDWTMNGPEDFVADPQPGDRFAPGAVSLARLRHTPPGKALTPFSRGVKFASTGGWQKSVDEFKKALAADPDFSEAHGNLGAAYSALHRFEEAGAEFRRAIELDPGTGIHHSNLAYVLIVLEHQKEAEVEAKTAVSLSPTDPTAHFLLGFLLACNPDTHIAAEQHLAYAARQIPDAHLMLAQLYFSQGSAQLGAAEMARYREAIGK